MTEREAKKIRSCYCNGVECKEGIGISDEFQELGEILNDALKKQIPQKAIKIRINQLGIKIGNCPRCNDSFKIEDIPYCSNCGQALDWSETR